MPSVVPALPLSLDLAGTWKIESADRAFRLKGPMPGSILHELEKAGAFGPEGFSWRMNNRKAPDLMRREWIVSRTFDWTPRRGEAVELVCEGLDTLATVRINGVAIGRADNMHRTWRFDAGRALREGRNEIEIRFADAIAFIEAARKKRDLFDGGGGAETMRGFNHLRKSHCSFGWDWGPQAPDAGIWRPIRLERVRARIDSTRIAQTHKGGKVVLGVRPELVGAAEGTPCRVTLRSPDGEVLGTAITDGEAFFVVENPQLWWPVDLGEQPLYEVVTELLDEKGETLASDRKRVGLRTLTVDRSPLKQGGERFAFTVNGVAFFARGADWIPEDVFLTRPTAESTRRLLEDARLAHFNNVRVWGGGVYPSDDFFDLCDELGLVVWQDLMFACAVYPWDSDPAFRETTLAEVRENVRRIRHHACLGLVCGNNEMEWGFEEWANVKPTKRTRREYLQMYQFDFAAILASEVPEVFYWPASPSSGGDFEDPNASDRGDVHFWKVWHGRAPFEEYAKHDFRFLSEFGFESFPSPATCRDFTLESDRNLFSPVMEDHQRCVGGNGTILYYMSEHLRLPKDFESSIRASQFIQGEAMRHGIEHLRRKRGVSMGAVYWQFNDNWPVASWSSVDWHGRWKMLHYVARRVFAPTLVSARIEGRTAELHVSHEGRGDLAGKLSWSLIELDGKAVKKGVASLRRKGLSSDVAVRLDFDRELAGDLLSARVLVWSFEGRTDGAPVSSEGSAAFDRIKRLELPDPGLEVEVKEDRDGPFVEVKAKRFAKCVWLETEDPGVVFEDDAFDLAPGRTRRIGLLRRPAKLGAKDLRKGLAVTSARDWHEDSSQGRVGRRMEK